MKRFHIVCILIVLCMLAGCTPAAEPAAETAVTEAPVIEETENSTEAPAAAETEAPASTPEPLLPERPLPTEEEMIPALLYAGERVNLYLARTEDSWGVVIEEFTWAKKICFYQPFPGTKGADGLTVTEIKPEADAYFTEALFYIRYLDADGQPRMFCLEHPASDGADFYPVIDGTELLLSNQEQSAFEDLMVIGFLYDDYKKEYAETIPDDWESLCQRTILDALYSLHDDTLPSYLSGEPYIRDCFIVTQTELDGFFRSTVNRPNVVPDRVYEDEDVYVEADWSKLQPGQVPIAKNDWLVWGVLKQAIPQADGSLMLYGYIGINDNYASAILLHAVPADGYLGWRVVDTEICGATDLRYDPSIVFIPVS